VIPDLSYKAYQYASRFEMDIGELDQGLRRHLEKLASAGGYASIDALVERLNQPEDSGENEITNRTIHHKTLAELLSRPNLTIEELKSAVDKVWALTGQQDMIRRTEFFNSDHALADIQALLDDSGDVPVAVRVNDFIEAATEHVTRRRTGGSARSCAVCERPAVQHSPGRIR